MAVTVSQIRDNARALADMENGNFVSPELWIKFIDKAYKKLYDLLVSKFEDWFTGDPLAFTVASGQSTYTLPEDFYKLRGVDRDLGGGEYLEIMATNLMHRNRRSLSSLRNGLYTRVQYILIGNKLRFVPADLAPGSYQLWYVPLAQTLTDEADTIDGVNGWEEYIELSAAKLALMKEESDTTQIQLELDRLERRIEEMAQNRDLGATSRVLDVTADNHGCQDFV
jgi:hypothetical protein